MDSGTEVLHRVRASIDVAQSMIGRSADLHGRGVVLGDHVLDGLIDAADALAAVALAVEEELSRRGAFGPAA